MKSPVFPYASEMSCFWFIFMLFFVISPINDVSPAQLTVNGPLHPVTASLSEDIVLHCHLSPRTSAENMEIKWFRSQNSSYVHLYHNGKEHLEKQQPEYQGRTELLTDGIEDGKIGLRILNVSFYDAGQYHCSVKNKSFHQEATLDIKVAALGSTPLISIERYQERGIYLVCRSRGWYPQPEVLWRNPSGKHLSFLAKETSQENNGLFEVQKDILLTEGSNQPLTCVVRNRLLNQEKGSTIHVADNFFPKIDPWAVGLCVSILVPVGLLIAILYLINRNRKLITELSWRNMVVPIEKANVTLDPSTANKELILSADQKNVIQGFMWHNLPDHPWRFDVERCILGKEGFSSGRHYWEVEVGEEGYWAVGVARESVRRKGRLSLDPDEGIWAVEKARVQTVQYQALTIPQTPLTLRKRPRKVGIYLDYELGKVAFHDVNHKMHIFTFFAADFNGETIFPFLQVGIGCWLTVCP
ncbi:butyrophilin subfamily 1 member A1 [Anolis carolinensis]|uniref:Butyrophilin subfamily 2 member A2 n=1 Tax=Anolis carolinensis TaxID=28377 RepID=G1KLA7_ANOCA|nr:PREDICTED: butyrophilin subfamily 1 member A1 [Anolis carolinensis]XP_016847318.1 PREDICTED: butyrophilin subfamily 1 member A1 [Anolis carolinensis]|eukprot:XP_008103839.1 PREDICTED: butyrophilin subfamily 1 member A1 [Anolis carolinensis]